METPVERELTPREIAQAREAQEIADGHRYQTQEFRDAREAQKPVSDRKKARDDAKAGGGKKDGPKKDMPAKATERIAKVLARAGLASRREVERLIGLGKIAVNGRILETPAVLVSSADVITVDGQQIGKADATRLWRYHKPVGLITTHSDPQGRPTLFEKLPQDLPRVISVGRLDLNSEGLLLLTNDGELARALEKPSSGWVRRYRVRALGNTSQARLDSLKVGTTVEGVIYGPMEASLDKVAEKADGRANVWLTVAITEGKNREVRKVLESIGLKVNRLIRLAYGPFLLGNLESGEVEEVGPRVIRELLADVVPLKNLPPEGASQTTGTSRERAGDAPQGRRGGGDRFKSDRPAFDKPRGERSFADKPFSDRTREDRPRGDGPRGKPGFAEKREYKERDFDQRPRFEGDGEARDRKPEEAGDFKPRFDRERPPRDSDRPAYAKKPYTPRSGGEGERKSYPAKPRFDRAAGGDARSTYTPRPDRAGQGERSDRSKPAYGDRPAPRKTYGARDESSAPRSGESGAYERAKREFGPRPARDGASDKPYTPREGASRDNAERGERRSYIKPFRADRPAGEGDARSTYTPRPERSGEGGGYKKPYDKKPYTPREGASRDGGDKPAYAKKPYAERGGAGGARPFNRERPASRDGADKPAYAKKPYASRDGAGSGERKTYGGGAKSSAPRGSFSKGPRPDGPRPSGPRPGGKPGGARPFNRKPRDA